MKKFNLPLVADTLFIAVCAFLLFFTAVRYYTRSAAWGLVCAIPASLLTGWAVFVYISRKQRGKWLSAREEKNRKQLALHLSLSSDEYVSLLFLKCLGESARLCGKQIEQENCLLFFAFKMQPLSEDDVARVIKRKYEGEKHVYCNRISPEARSLAEDFGVKLILVDDVYRMLEEKQMLPEKYIYEGEKKVSALRRIKNRFNRKLCLPLFWSGAALMLLSYFTFFPIYYIVSGGILLALSATALVLGKK